MGNENTKKCPFCGEEILKEAKKCKHCGEFLEEKENVKTKKETKGKCLWQFLFFFFMYGLLGGISTTNKFFGIVLIALIFWYCFSSYKDDGFFNFKEILTKKRLTSVKRIIAFVLLLIMSLSVIGAGTAKERACKGFEVKLLSEKTYLTGYTLKLQFPEDTEKALINMKAIDMNQLEQNNYIYEEDFSGTKGDINVNVRYNSKQCDKTTPFKIESTCKKPVINVKSKIGNIGDSDKYILKLDLEETTILKIDGEVVETNGFNYEKEFVLVEPTLSISVEAENDCNIQEKIIEVSRNKTQEEIQKEQEEQELQRKKEEEERQRQYDEKNKRINLLKSRCRSSYDEFQKITRYEPNVIKNTNNQSAMMVYIGVDDNGNPFKRLKIMYASRDWLFVRNYQFSIGGNVITYIPSKVNRDNYTTVWEWSDDSMGTKENDLINAIIENNGATIRYNGNQYYNDRTLGQKEVNALKDMQELYSLLQEKKEIGF